MSPLCPTSSGSDSDQSQDQVHPSPNDIDSLALSYVPSVRALAARVYESLPPGVPVDFNDLVQAGLVGLMNAARAYDPSRNDSFLLFARYRIRGEILDTLRRMDDAPRQLRRFGKMRASAVRELTSHLQREPTEEEIFQRIGLDAEEGRDKSAALATLNKPMDLEQCARHLKDNHPESHPAAVWARRQGQKCLGQAVRKLSKRHRQLIFLYYAKEMTLKQIGQVLRVNESRVCQLHKDALERMASGLRAIGFHSSADMQGVNI